MRNEVRALKLKSRLKHLKHADPKTSDAIMEQYLPDWDGERLFQKTYAAFREQESGEITPEDAQPPVRNRLTRIVRYGGYGIAAAMYIGLIVGVVRLTQLPPPEILRVPEEIPTAAVSQTTPAESETAAPQETSEPPEQEPAVHTDAPAQADEPTSAAAEESHAVTDAPAQTDAAETPATVPAVTPTTAAPSVTTAGQESPPPPASAQTVTETTAPDNTISPVVTAAPTEPEPTEDEPAPLGNATTPQALGHFEIIPSNGGQLPKFTYVRDTDAPVEEHEHSFAAEGFTVTSEQWMNETQDYRSKMIQIEDSEGQSYLVYVFRYAYFGTQFNPEAHSVCYSYSIDGRPAYVMTDESEGSLCTIYWDDGCHVCAIYSQRKDQAKMELLIRSEINLD